MMTLAPAIQQKGLSKRTLWSIVVHTIGFLAASSLQRWLLQLGDANATNTLDQLLLLYDVPPPQPQFRLLPPLLPPERSMKIVKMLPMMQPRVPLRRTPPLHHNNRIDDDARHGEIPVSPCWLKPLSNTKSTSCSLLGQASPSPVAFDPFEDPPASGRITFGTIPPAEPFDKTRSSGTMSFGYLVWGPCQGVCDRMQDTRHLKY
jgi:hypothetical protein